MNKREEVRQLKAFVKYEGCSEIYDKGCGDCVLKPCSEYDKVNLRRAMQKLNKLESANV